MRGENSGSLNGEIRQAAQKGTLILGRCRERKKASSVINLLVGESRRIFSSCYYPPSTN